MKKNSIAQDKINEWAVDPALFVREVFGAEPQEWQIEALRSIATGDRVAIKSGHGIGKTTTLAWLIFWWLSTRIPAKVAITANTASQLSDVLWSELGAWHQKMRFKSLAAQFEIKSDKVSLKGTSDSFAVARTSSKDRPEALQGFHSENMMFLIDEASGVFDKVFEVARGALSTPGSKVVMTGNPTRTTGYFYDAFHGAAESWHRMTVPSTRGEYVSDTFVAEMARDYGENSNAYRVRVLGDFPTSDEDAVIARGIIEAAVRREVEESEGAPIVWGLDPARFGGDRTALCKRKGNAVIDITSWRNLDLMETAGRVKSEYDAATWDRRPVEVLVDSIGLGAGLVDRLRELGLPVRGVYVSESPSVADRFLRLRDELWWAARDWFEARDCSLIDNDVLVNELALPLYSFSSAGKIKIEGKDETKKRYGGKSPDLADAFILTFASSAAMAAGSGRWVSWNKPIEYRSVGIV